ncbi:MAG TPA: DUF6624 domain-containing protein, partial [Vicinamibacteria bacterium]|nr:DUF6624 domain-containing protein [Vicinamibacteria bacterium]
DDARVRARLARDGSLFRGYHPEMEAVHRRNAERLAAILDRHGWPGQALAGEDGAAAAWLVAQHAISMPAFMRRARTLLAEAVERGDAPAAQLAHLEDRIRTLEGRPQLYGTQLDWDESGQLAPLPLEDEAHVDERRAATGLGPLRAHAASARASAARDGEQPPPDLEARRREMAAWARSVGWRD